MANNSFLRPLPHSTLLFRRAMGYYFNKISLPFSGLAGLFLASPPKTTEQAVFAGLGVIIGAIGVAGGVALSRQGIHYTEDDFAKENLSPSNLSKLTRADLDMITDADWLYLLTSNHASIIGTALPKFLTPKRLGRIDKKVIAQIIARTPEKSVRILINSHLASLAPARPSRVR